MVHNRVRDPPPQTGPKRGRLKERSIPSRPGDLSGKEDQLRHTTYTACSSYITAGFSAIEPFSNTKIRSLSLRVVPVSDGLPAYLPAGLPARPLGRARQTQFSLALRLS